MENQLREMKLSNLKKKEQFLVRKVTQRKKMKMSSAMPRVSHLKIDKKPLMRHIPSGYEYGSLPFIRRVGRSSKLRKAIFIPHLEEESVIGFGFLICFGHYSSAGGWH